MFPGLGARDGIAGEIRPGVARAAEQIDARRERLADDDADAAQLDLEDGLLERVERLAPSPGGRQLVRAPPALLETQAEDAGARGLELEEVFADLALERRVLRAPREILEQEGGVVEGALVLARAELDEGAPHLRVGVDRRRLRRPLRGGLGGGDLLAAGFGRRTVGLVARAAPDEEAHEQEGRAENEGERRATTRARRRGRGRRGEVRGVEEDLETADLDAVPVLESHLRDLGPVDRRAVGRAEIDDAPGVAASFDARVLPRTGALRQHDVGALVAPEHVALVERDLDRHSVLHELDPGHADLRGVRRPRRPRDRGLILSHRGTETTVPGSAGSRL
ncbi:MAG: hypothetical protein R3F20_04435 [Planctomycetota bacterium]